MLTEILPLVLASCSLLLIDWHLRSGARLQIVDGSIPFSLRAMVAATTPLLWFRVLGHLKMFNKQLATFILCSVEIMRDIKWVGTLVAVILLCLSVSFCSQTWPYITLSFSLDTVHAGASHHHRFVCANAGLVDF